MVNSGDRYSFVSCKNYEHICWRVYGLGSSVWEYVFFSFYLMQCNYNYSPQWEYCNVLCWLCSCMWLLDQLTQDGMDGNAVLDKLTKARCHAVSAHAQNFLSFSLLFDNTLLLISFVLYFTFRHNFNGMKQLQKQMRLHSHRFVLKSKQRKVDPWQTYMLSFLSAFLHVHCSIPCSSF